MDKMTRVKMKEKQTNKWMNLTLTKTLAHGDIYYEGGMTMEILNHKKDTWSKAKWYTPKWFQVLMRVTFSLNQWCDWHPTKQAAIKKFPYAGLAPNFSGAGPH